MTAVLLVVNESRPRAGELARQAAAQLTARGHSVRLPKEDARASGLDEFGAEPGPALVEGVGLAVALGGDGTMLRAVHLAAPEGIPVLGVNLGRLGYLAVLEPDALSAALDRFLAGECFVEERAMLAGRIEGRAPAPPPHLALNEAVLEHSGAGHTVHLAVGIGGRPFTSHVADALIVATPTGSTAYSFSAGGPIVSPRHHALVVTPVAPHTPFTRSLVVHPSEAVRVEVLDHRGAILSVDGQEMGHLARGEALVATVAPRAARFVTFGAGDFYGVLKAKFGLADR
ncbi:MAG TPA: NAD(+)/NADH kinase [Acidimicrobiales bacterium]|jgi:NAD+ kinase|nr:NAD(+)/NADH kinase [Acidimicrobiales bacterium]